MLDKDIITINKKNISKDNLLKEALENISNNKDLNAFNLVIENPEYEENSSSLLNKIPYVLKDNFSTKGFPTTASSNILKGYKPVYDSTVYKKLKASGAICVAKANMDELAMGGTGTTGAKGVVCNPYDLNKIAGGSSAGSAAAVAAGIVPFSIGSDTGDSVRKPAAFTGTVGFKPSYGLISRFGLFAFASSMDHVGVFTRNVQDAAIVTNYIKGFDENDLTSIHDMDDVDLTLNLDTSLKGKKIFYIKEVCNKDVYQNNNTKIILDKFQETLSLLKSEGVDVYEESVDLNLLNAIKPVYDIISCAEATSNNSNLTGIPFGPRGKGENIYDVMKDARTKGFSSLIKRRFVIGSFALQKENQEKYFLNAKRARRAIVNKFNELFEKYDALIMPCSGDVAPDIKNANNKISKSSIETVLENHLAIANFGGYPSITIPNGLLNAMPIGINITGKYKDDMLVLNIANILESKMNYKNMISKEANHD